MKYREEAVLFDCAGDELVGILARPDREAAIGVVILVGGPQYRAGSHRQFVSLARALAAGGYPVLRFDYRGMGDSRGEPHAFDAVRDDVGAAAVALRAACPAVERIVLWGLCDAASAALLYWDETRDPAIAGLVAVNPWVRSEATLARTWIKHYYGQRLLEPEFWKKLLGGKLNLGKSLLEFWRNAGRSFGRTAAPAQSLSYQGRMARGWRDFPGRILLVLSGRDYGAKEFLEYAGSDPAWSGLLACRGVERIDVPEADHTFSTAGDSRRLEAVVLDWLQRQASAAARRFA